MTAVMAVLAWPFPPSQLPYLMTAGIIIGAVIGWGIKR